MPESVRDGKIFVIIQSLRFGGAERVAANLSKYLGENIVLVVFENIFDYSYEGRKICLNSPAQKYIIGKLFAFLYRWFALWKLKIKEKPVLSISFSEGTNFINILSKTSEKVIISVHENKSASRGTNFFLKSIYGSLIKLLYNYADGVVCVSDGIKTDLIKNFGLIPRKLTVIYNPIDIKGVQQLSLENPPINSKIFNSPVFCAIGRLTYQKGFWYLIRAFHKLYKDFPNIKLLIIGEGEMRGLLEELSRDYGFRVFSAIENNIELATEDYDIYFLGFQKNPFMFLKKSMTMVSTSLWEGFGIAIVEALACGKPVIATDCPSGPREILSNSDVVVLNKPELAEFGILVPVCDGRVYQKKDLLTKQELILSDGMKSLLEDDGLIEKYSKNTERRANDFDIDVSINEWKKYINKINEKI